MHCYQESTDIIKTRANNAIEPTRNSLLFFSFRRLWPGRLMASVICSIMKTNAYIP